MKSVCELCGEAKGGCLCTPAKEPELALFDLNGLVHRAFHGHAPSAGKVAFQWVARALKALRPSHAAACMDLPFPTFRHDLAPATYKAKGRATGQERAQIMGALRQASEMIEDFFGVRVLAAKGFEADDVIATLVELRPIDMKVTIVARDKDLCQLLSPCGDVRMIDFQDSKTVNWVSVKERYGVTPLQFVDYQALVGDNGDGYPGCPGIGAKAAKDLLGEFGELGRIVETRPDGVYVVAGPKVSQTVRTKLRQGIESIELSLKLARLRTDVPMTDLAGEQIGGDFRELAVSPGALEDAERFT